jgi:hypothetical protein
VVEHAAKGVKGDVGISVSTAYALADFIMLSHVVEEG